MNKLYVKWPCSSSMLVLLPMVFMVDVIGKCPTEPNWVARNLSPRVLHAKLMNMALNIKESGNELLGVPSRRGCWRKFGISRHWAWKVVILQTLFRVDFHKRNILHSSFGSQRSASILSSKIRNTLLPTQYIKSLWLARVYGNPIAKVLQSIQLYINLSIWW